MNYNGTNNKIKNGFEQRKNIEGIQLINKWKSLKK